jgi:hypothetical protein
MIWRLYYIPAAWSKPWDDGSAERDGFLRSVASADVGEELETLNPGDYELRQDGDTPIRITIGRETKNKSNRKGR